MNWIDKYRQELWPWIVHCYDENDDRKDICDDCPHKTVCNAIWEVVKHKETKKDSG